MEVRYFADLPQVARRAVIINVGTRWVSTLALLSALRYARMPVLLVDCESPDGSVEHFRALMLEHDFDFVRVPLRPHGEALDVIFREVPADRILLIDSDAEILSVAIMEIIDQMDVPRIFGAGFTHGPERLQPRQFYDHDSLGMYQERMWIPFTYLDVPRIREALDSGLSFTEKMIYNDFASSESVAKLLHARFRIRALRNTRLRFLDPFRRRYYGAKPCYVYCDTGAEIYQFLKYDREYLFAGLPARLHGGYVAHYHGITRRQLNRLDTNAAVLDDVSPQILDRLRDEYQMAVPSSGTLTIPEVGGAAAAREIDLNAEDRDPSRDGGQ